MWTLLMVALASDGAPLNGMTLIDVARTLPDCVTAAATPMLDFEEACVAGGCVGMTVAQLDAAFEEAGECKPSSGSSGLQICKWFDGRIKAHFRDIRGAGATAIFVTAPDWRTADGLGVGSQLSCFLDRFGDTASGMRVEVENGWLSWGSVHFRSPPVIVTVAEDATIEKVQLNGSPGR